METNLPEIRFSAAQTSGWLAAEKVFKWCEHYLPPCHQRLDATILKKLAAGQVPQKLLKKMRADISRALKGTLPWSEYFAVVRKVLKNPKDYSTWMNCPNGEHHKLPKRLRDIVSKGEKERRDQLHDDFFARVDDAKMAEYVRAWQSGDLAKTILISLACGEITIDELDNRTHETGYIGIGRLRLDEKRWVLRSVESLGSLKGRGVPHIISRLAQSDDRPFFIKLGRALAKADALTKRPEVEWADVNKVARFIADYWCCRPTGWDMPPLCLLDNGTLAMFCALALGKDQADKETNITSIRKWVSRLRLKRAKSFSA